MPDLAWVILGCYALSFFAGPTDETSDWGDCFTFGFALGTVFAVAAVIAYLVTGGYSDV